MKIFLNKSLSRELKRQTFHILLGLILGFGVGFNLIGGFGLLAIFVVSLFLAWLLDEGYSVPFFETFLNCCERPEERNGLRGGGFVAFILGALIVDLFFSDVIAAAAIIMLGIADTMSALISKNFGKLKHPFGEKYLEGHILGALLGAIVASYFVPFWPIFVAGLVGMFFEGIEFIYEFDFLDDNFIVPIIVAIILQIIL